MHATDRHGWTALHGAAVNNRAGAVTYLIAAGSDVEARGTDAWTPLHAACVSGSSRAVAALVRGGADVNAIARSDDTPIHLALMAIVNKAKTPDAHRQSARRAQRIIEILLEAGANPLAPDSEGRVPADIALERGAASLAAMLQSR